MCSGTTSLSAMDFHEEHRAASVRSSSVTRLHTLTEPSLTCVSRRGPRSNQLKELSSYSTVARVRGRERPFDRVMVLVGDSSSVVSDRCRLEPPAPSAIVLASLLGRLMEIGRDAPKLD